MSVLDHVRPGIAWRLRYLERRWPRLVRMAWPAFWRAAAGPGAAGRVDRQSRGLGAAFNEGDRAVLHQLDVVPVACTAIDGRGAIAVNDRRSCLQFCQRFDVGARGDA